MTLLDNLIGFVSPEKAFKRYRYRAALQMMQRHYEGSGHGRRTKGWLAPSTDANAALDGSLETLRNRARDLARNNPYAKRGIRAIRANVVGYGILGKIITNNTRLHKEVVRLWEKWAETSAIDYDQRHNLYGLQALIMQTVAESGECLVRRRFVRPTPQNPLGLQIQVLEPDFLNASNYGVQPVSGNIIKHGIEFTPQGKRVAYHLYSEHPGQQILAMPTMAKSIRVPADEIIHVYEQDRPGQVRGVPWLSAAVIKLRDLDSYDDAQLVRQKIAACFTAFVRDVETPESSLVNAVGAVGEKDVEDPMLERVEPGMIQLLPPGKDISFAQPPSVENYKEFMSVNLQSIAASLGITYEVLTNDLSQVNFSSGRMGWIEMQRNIEDWRWLLLIPQCLDVLFQWFLDAAVITGRVMNQDLVSIAWTPPKREMIDPTKEVPSFVQAVRAGFMTLQEVQRMYGYDPNEVLDEIAETNLQLDVKKITLDTDPRKVVSQL